MSPLCHELQRALKNRKNELPETLLRHVEGCPGCTDTLRSWKDISAAAQSMKKAWESPQLWPQINRSLSEASSRHTHEKSGRDPFWKSIRILGVIWRPALTGVFLLALCLVGIWSLRYRYQPGTDSSERLLTEQALREVETAEQAYIQSIEKLSGLVPSQAQTAESPLLTSYREKLTVIDEAIADCRSYIEGNRFNAHLRGELLTLYREKQNTLQEFLKEDRYVEN